MKTIDEIWEKDLFDRKGDAAALQAYIESLGAVKVDREDGHSYTIAVDAEYGYGKSFFLRRLKEQLELTHPVAYVDAWADDIADEPLVALAATLKAALGGLTSSNQKLEDQVNGIIDKIGNVSKVVGKGLLMKGLALLLTEGVASELPAALMSASETGKAVHGTLEKALDEAVKEGGAELLKKAADNMADRIADYEAAKALVRDLKTGLAAIVKTLHDTGKRRQSSSLSTS